MNVFVTEGNVEIYLSRLHTTWSATERDSLLRLLVQEESAMGEAREHVDQALRRIGDGRHRIDRQRAIVASLPPEEAIDHPDRLLLETLEQTQTLLQEHLQALSARWAAKAL